MCIILRKDLKADVAELNAHFLATQDHNRTLEQCREKESQFTRDSDDITVKLEDIDDKVLYVCNVIWISMIMCMNVDTKAN